MEKDEVSSREVFNGGDVFCQRQKSKRNQKSIWHSKFWFSWIVYFFFVCQVKLIWKHIYYEVNTYIYRYF